MSLTSEREEKYLEQVIDKISDLKSSGIFKPTVWLGYNANGDLVLIRKYYNGKWYRRSVVLPGVTDFNVAYWEKYGGSGPYPEWIEE